MRRRIEKERNSDAVFSLFMRSITLFLISLDSHRLVDFRYVIQTCKRTKEIIMIWHSNS